MNRFEQFKALIEHDFERNVIIEPENRYEVLKESLFDVIKGYNPGVIIKAGLGSGRLAYEIAKEFDSYFVIVEPSFNVIQDFKNRYKDEVLEKIHFINGDFTFFPIDYYAADLLISIDFFDFLETGKIIDEFRRILQFDAVLFLAAIVLHDDDIEGIYDDYMRVIFPLHNDYYLKDDLKTIMKLNEFKFIKGNLEYITGDLSLKIDYFKKLYNDRGDPIKFIEEHKDSFDSLYKMNNGTISVPYFFGVFMRIKPDNTGYNL